MAFTNKDVMDLRAKTGVGMMDCKKALTEADGDMEKAIEILREKGMATSAKRAGKIASQGIVEAYSDGKYAVLVEVNCESDFVARGEQYKAFVNEVAKYIAENDVQTAEEVTEGMSVALAEAVAKIGEKIAIRRFVKYEVKDNTLESYIHMGGKIGVLVELSAGCNKEVAHDVAMQIAATKPEYVSREEVPAEIVEKEKEIIKAQAINEGKPEAIAEKMVEGRIEKYYKEVCLLEQEFVKNPDVTIKQLLTEKISNIGENITIRRFVRFERGEGIQKREENFAEEVMKQING